jgi:lysophospholipase
MTLTPAPFHADVALGPEGGSAFWMTASDGVRIRVGYWPVKDALGTLLLFPGRTEYIEKYGMTAVDLAERGYATITVDWRGQGLADRLLQDRRVGHVDQFLDFQKDVACVMQAVEALNVPKPLHVLGHSMGGAIGLRALYEGLPVQSCIFTGPMWGIRMATLLRPVAWGLFYASGWTGQGHRLAPSMNYENYVQVEKFAGNTLTSDPDMYALMQNQLKHHPELALGGASLTWLGESLRECRKLAQRAAPSLPCTTYIGSDEAIVDVDAIHTRMAAWPNGTLQVVDGAQHEVLMETPATRRMVLDQMVAQFAATGKPTPIPRSA